MEPTEDLDQDMPFLGLCNCAERKTGETKSFELLYMQWQRIPDFGRPLRRPACTPPEELKQFLLGFLLPGEPRPRPLTALLLLVVVVVPLSSPPFSVVPPSSLFCCLLRPLRPPLSLSCQCASSPIWRPSFRVGGCLDPRCPAQCVGDSHLFKRERCDHCFCRRAVVSGNNSVSIIATSDHPLCGQREESWR